MMRPFNNKPYQGINIKALNAFTLVELMVVLAIISILLSIALPSYQTVTRKGQRVEGKALLLEVQSQMERYYFSHQTYPDRLSKLRVYSLDLVESENTHYQVSLDKSNQACLPAYCYLIIAKHSSGQKQEELGLHSNGDKDGPW